VRAELILQHLAEGEAEADEGAEGPDIQEGDDPGLRITAGGPPPASPAASGTRSPGTRSITLTPSQYTSVRFAETLMLAGLAGSIGTVGDAYDNALAETTIGLYKSECAQDGSPFRDGPLATLAQVEKITSARAHWYNNDRLMHRTGLRPPAEADARYWAGHA